MSHRRSIERSVGMHRLRRVIQSFNQWGGADAGRGDRNENTRRTCHSSSSRTIDSPSFSWERPSCGQRCAATQAQDHITPCSGRACETPRTGPGDRHGQDQIFSPAPLPESDARRVSPCHDVEPPTSPTNVRSRGEKLSYHLRVRSADAP
jgi:hypothetical protein